MARCKIKLTHMTSKELCHVLGLSDERALLTTKNFPKHSFSEGEMLFKKDKILKYFNIDNFDEPFIGHNEAAEYLGIGTAKLQQMAIRHEIPNYRLKNIKGSGYLYRKSELEKFTKINFEGDAEFLNYFVGNEIIKNVFLNFLEKSLEGTKKRDYEIVCRYFLERLNFEELSKEYGITRERARQIFEKTIKRVKQINTYSPKVYFGLERKLIAKEKEISYLKFLLLNQGKKENELIIPERQPDNFFLRKELDNFDLSVRALNCIHDAEVKNLNDLAVFCYKDNFKSLLKLKNMGKRTMKEIQEFLDEYSHKLEIGTGFTLRELVGGEGMIIKSVEPG